MPDPSEEFYEVLKEEHVNKYFDRYDLNVEEGNPLAHVTPLDVDDFFGPKVINIICLTGPFIDWDWNGVEECVTRLQAIYDQFIGYETHFIIDEAAEAWEDASEGAQDETKEEFESLVNDYDSNSFGVYYWGPLQGDALQSKIRELLAAFYD